MAEKWQLLLKWKVAIFVYQFNTLIYLLIRNRPNKHIPMPAAFVTEKDSL